MKTIEIDTEIDEHHEIHIKLPDDCAKGKARVIVLIDKDDVPSTTKKRKFGQFRSFLVVIHSFRVCPSDA